MDIDDIPHAVHELAAKRAPGEVGYNNRVRVLVVRYTRARRAEGATWAEVAAALPVSPTTARTWLMQADGEPTEPRFVPVVVDDDPPQPHGLVLHSPSGFRLEGFGLEDAARLLRALG